MRKTKTGLFIADIGNIEKNDPQYCYGRLLRSLCLFKEEIRDYAYGPAHGVPEWSEVTEQFWSEYMKKGVCAIHGDFSHNWDVKDNIRTCQYCGKVEYKKIIMVPKETWEDAEDTSKV